MFNDYDTSLMAHPYFTVISSNDIFYELKSNCTGHYWKIIQYNSNCLILHKHKELDEYHYQRIYCNVFDCVLDIVCHDEFQLNNRNPLIPDKNTVATKFIDELLNPGGYLHYNGC